MRWLALLAWCLIGCDDSEPDFGGNATGRDNGEACLTSTASSPCKSALCLPFVEGGDRGVCGERCTESCRFGGTCVRYAIAGLDADRVCLQACAAAACGEQTACLPLSEAYECGAGGCAQEASDKAWCQPPL